MKGGKASRTAEGSAAFRALESLRPENERVYYDPYAKDFLGPMYSGMYRAMARSRLLRKIGIRAAEYAVPGCLGAVAACHAHVDDYLKVCIDNGIEQLVNLGAGYDSRAYRFDALKGKIKVFEVDDAATQARKVERLRKILGSLPDNVVYVPIDFTREKLGPTLFESGYDANLKTLFIWEAVTMYITAEAVDETLDFVANNSGGGSSIIFDYIFPSVVDGTCELEGAKRWRRNVRRMGEPFTFGIEQDAIEGFLSKRGFHQVENVTGDSLKSTYYEAANQNRKMQRFHGHVHATVKPHGSADQIAKAET